MSKVDGYIIYYMKVMVKFFDDLPYPLQSNGFLLIENGVNIARISRALKSSWKEARNFLKDPCAFGVSIQQED